VRSPLAPWTRSYPAPRLPGCLHAYKSCQDAAQAGAYLGDTSAATVDVAAACLDAAIYEQGEWHTDAGLITAALIMRLPDVAKEAALERCDEGRLSCAPPGVLAPALAARCEMRGEPPLRTIGLPYYMLTSMESARSIAAALAVSSPVQRLELVGVTVFGARRNTPTLRLSHARELAGGLANAPSLCALRLDGAFEADVQACMLAALSPTVKEVDAAAMLAEGRRAPDVDSWLACLVKLECLERLGVPGHRGLCSSVLSHVAMWSGLRQLVLSDASDITATDVARLAALPGLQKLSLQRCFQLGDAGLAQLAALTRLRFLALSEEGRRPGAPGRMGRLQQCGQVSEAGLAALTALVGLRHLALCDFGYLGSATTAHLAGLTGLTGLVLDKCTQLHDSALGHLAALTGLRYLSLEMCELITSAGIDHLAALSSLTGLVLDGCEQFGDSSLSHLVTLTALRKLSLAVCCQEVAADVVQIAALTRLNFLVLAHWQLVDTCVSHLASLTALAYLDLQVCYNVGEAALSSLSVLAARKHLDLTVSADVGDTGMAAVGSLTSLTFLGLTPGYDFARNHQRSCPGDIGAAQLAKLKRLQCLNVSHWERLGDAGMVHFAALTDLRSLNLSCCTEVTGAGLAHVSQLTRLEHVRLCGCQQLCDTELLHLSGLTRLTSIFIGSSQFPRDTVRDQLPVCPSTDGP
jgi:Leucine Rich repeat